MPAYHYRITVDMLSETGEDGLHSLSFFASDHDEVFTAAKDLRDRLDCSACHATKLAIARCLLGGISLEQQDSALSAELLAATGIVLPVERAS